MRLGVSGVSGCCVRVWEFWVLRFGLSYNVEVHKTKQDPFCLVSMILRFLFGLRVRGWLKAQGGFVEFSVYDRGRVCGSPIGGFEAIHVSVPVLGQD